MQVITPSNPERRKNLNFIIKKKKRKLNRQEAAADPDTSTQAEGSTNMLEVHRLCTITDPLSFLLNRLLQKQTLTCIDVSQW